MKKILSFIIAASLILPIFGSTAHAQQLACLQASYGDKLKVEATNLYSYITVSNKKMWLWTSPSASYMNMSNYTYGTWQCANDNKDVTINAPIGTLPACVQKLKTLTVSSDDPNALQYSDSVYGKVSLFISNKRYQIVQTRQSGTWTCDLGNGLLTLIGAVKPTPNDPANPGIQDQNDPANPGIKDTSTAQVTDAPLNIKLNNPLKVNNIQDAIKLFMDAVVKIAIPFIVVFFIWSGLQFILARGKPEKLKTARNMFWYTIIGTLLILGAWAITDAIVGTINSIAS